MATGKIAFKPARQAFFQQALKNPMLFEFNDSVTNKRTFSTSLATQTLLSNTVDLNLGTVTRTRTLKQLDASVVKMIEAELKEVDTDADGRYVITKKTFSHWR
jgi:hypothetical protein